MADYRIKIEERYNGEKRYIPQICKLETWTWGWIQKQRLVWYNLINNHGDIYILSTDTHAARQATEELAMRVINDYKDYHIKEQGNKVKSTTYKYPDSSN